MKLIEVFRYREKMVFGAKFPRDHEMVRGFQEMVPREKRDNHQVAIFDIGEDEWKQNCYIAVYFHDFHVYLGDVSLIENGEMATVYRDRDKQ